MFLGISFNITSTLTFWKISKIWLYSITVKLSENVQVDGVFLQSVSVRAWFPAKHCQSTCHDILKKCQNHQIRPYVTYVRPPDETICIAMAGEVTRIVNSSLVPLSQGDSKCENDFDLQNMKLQAELIFIWKVSHLDSVWNRGTRELGNGLMPSWFGFDKSNWNSP